MLVFHASKEVVEFPEIRTTRFTKDFSWGFYCTVFYEQAERWARRGPGIPTINCYEYKSDARLNLLTFPEMNDEWLNFIASCRAGKDHAYDVVEGPMADDTIWNYANDYLLGNINREQFWVLAKFRSPTHQVCFHTPTALNCLTYIKSEFLQ